MVPFEKSNLLYTGCLQLVYFVLISTETETIVCKGLTGTAVIVVDQSTLKLFTVVGCSRLTWLVSEKSRVTGGCRIRGRYWHHVDRNHRPCRYKLLFLQAVALLFLVFEDKNPL